MSRKQHHYTLVKSGNNVDIPQDVHHFYYSLGAWGFSVRLDEHHSKEYWYAYKRINGKLQKRYVSTRDELTPTALMAIAFVFENLQTEADLA